MILTQGEISNKNTSTFNVLKVILKASVLVSKLCQEKYPNLYRNTISTGQNILSWTVFVHIPNWETNIVRVRASILLWFCIEMLILCSSKCSLRKKLCFTNISYNPSR